MYEQKCYFGSANSYGGFVSNFNKIFAASKVDKLFIIKGGPGTGKSTLMKKIHKRYAEGFDTTVLLCSSDPESFDGVLISDGRNTVAIVDGTAPHVVDPKFPGAIEEIVNLADAFDLQILATRKNDIVGLTENKKSAYDNAYAALQTAGGIHRYIKQILSRYECYIVAEELINSHLILSRWAEKSPEKSDFMVGAFSKNGYKILNTSPTDKRIVRIFNDGILGYIITSKIVDLLKKNGIYFKLFSSAFSEDLIDLVETDEAIYVISSSKSVSIDSMELYKYIEDYTEVKSIYDYFIEGARRSLAVASEYHFMLENIYSGAIDFSENESKYNYMVNTIDDILINNVD